MNTEKNLERQIRTNQRLKEEYAELQKKYDELFDEANQPIEEVIALMNELKDIEKEWSEALEDINKYKEEYKALIDDLRKMRNKAKRGRL